MSTSTDLQEDLLVLASDHAGDSERLCADVAAMVFPRAIFQASEELLAQVTAQIVHIVKQLEGAILPPGATPEFGPSLLRQSHVLRSPALIDFAMARYAERRIEKRLAANSSLPLSETLPASLLSRSEHQIGDAAQLILANSSMNRRNANAHWSQLSPELLHMLCWRIVAAGQTENEEMAEAVRLGARNVLSRYDQSNHANIAARRMLHLLGPEYQQDLQNSEKAGLALFVGNLATKIGIEEDHILRLIDQPSLAAFSILQNAAGFDQHLALHNLRHLIGIKLMKMREIELFEKGYAKLDREGSLKTVADWRLARETYLGSTLARDSVQT